MHKNIYLFLLTVHDILSLSCHEQKMGEASLET